MLMEDEGCELVAYPDPISHGAPWTIGYGHTGPEVHLGLEISQAQAEADLDADIAKTEAGLNKALAWFAGLDPVRQGVIVNMGYNLGVAGLLQFKHMLADVEDQDWKGAAAQMRSSLWARQVQGRAYRLASLMETGAY